LKDKPSKQGKVEIKMKDKSLVVAKINFRNIRLAYIITAITLGAIIAQDIVYLILDATGVFSGEDNMVVGTGNYLYLILLLGAIFIPSLNFRKMMHLGGKRADFFKGCFATYIIMAAAISLAGVILYFTYELLLTTILYRGGNLNVLYWFGWLTNGPIVAFFRQFAFLLLLAVVVHTLTAMQDKWYGWLADVVIVAIISVFTPIAPLRAALVWFFNMIILHTNALVQIASCLVLAILVYAANKPVLARKVI
jgi:hypothetical protein